MSGRRRELSSAYVMLVYKPVALVRCPPIMCTCLDTPARLQSSECRHGQFSSNRFESQVDLMKRGQVCTDGEGET